MLTRSALGIRGEELVARYLSARGYAIRDRNWRTSGGEIDLVAEFRGEIVFVEVKTRRGREYGLPEEAVTRRKRDHLRAVAYAYMSAHRLDQKPFRIDIVAVSIPPDGTRPRLAHFRNAVGEEG
jgi:putative endonuclease